MNNIELKECPFCGGKPAFRDNGDGIASGVYCTECGIGTIIYNRSHQENIANIWNNRSVEVSGFDIIKHLERQKEFSERTFGPGKRTKGVLDHIEKELKEIEENPDDLSEWIDVVILALDGAWRSGYNPYQIIGALIAKQYENEARKWPDWRTRSENEAILHVKSENDDDNGENLIFKKDKPTEAGYYWIRYEGISSHVFGPAKELVRIATATDGLGLGIYGSRTWKDGDNLSGFVGLNMEFAGPLPEPEN